MKYKNENQIGSLNLVTALGVSIMLLSLYRLWFDSIPPTLILGISIASFGFVFSDFLSTFDRVNTRFKVYLVLFSMVSLICLPYTPYFMNMNEEALTKVADTISFLVFGLTIALIGIKGYIEAADAHKENLAFIEELKKNTQEIMEEIIKIKEELEEKQRSE